MKKSVLALILLAVLIIIVSPGIVGRLAENSVGESLNWAAEESGELVVTSAGFDRGWFSSEGQHRIALGQGSIRAAMTTASDDDIPVLLINTHIDHGLIPISSLAREEGSLAPGLGSAVSTLALELSNGEIIDLPGTVYSKVGLSGDLDSKYVLPAGNLDDDDGEITWQATTISIATSVETGRVEFGGDIGAMTFGNDQQTVAIDGLTFDGQQESTPYGFSVGNLDISMGPMSVNKGGLPIGGMQSLTVVASSSVDDGLVAADMRFAMSGQAIPGFGEFSVSADMGFSGIDAPSLGAVAQGLENLTGAQDPAIVMMTVQEDLKDLVAAGLEVAVNQLDFTLPMGIVEMKMSLAIPATDRASFEWVSLLLGVVASVDISIPEALVQLATSFYPEAGALIGMGYLKQEGDAYVLDAKVAKGLLTINGAPMPLPLGAFQ